LIQELNNKISASTYQFNQKALNLLEWSRLLEMLSSGAQTADGIKRCLATSPDAGLGQDQILARWQRVLPLRDLARTGYHAPIGNVKEMHRIFLDAKKAAIFDGEGLWSIYELLLSSRKVMGFIQNFSAKAPWFAELKSKILGLPDLYNAIERTVGPDFQLLDTASEALQSIRKQKVSHRKRLEDQAQKLLLEPSIQDYLQDQYFTVRNDKFVLPIRLDGRGRVKGQIIDTSDSGQTLLIEPVALQALNEAWHDLEVQEKIEIQRIYRDLSLKVHKEIEVLKANYEALVELDVLTAEALLAQKLDAGPVAFLQQPGLELWLARHPLIRTPQGRSAEPNSILLADGEEDEQKILVVSGPNAGGKTVVLKTVGLLHMMVKAGLMVPADPKSKMYLFDRVMLEMGDAQNIAANLSTFSGHIFGIKPILTDATHRDLVLLDELANGTEPHTGAAIARSIIEFLAHRAVTAVVTTHFDALKSLAVESTVYRNASMEYSEATFKPTYRLILDVPGQSYGLEVAEQMGLPSDVIARARVLRGSQISVLDDAVAKFNKVRQELESHKRQLEKDLLAAQSSKLRWEEECRLLEMERQKAARATARKLEDHVESLKSEIQEAAQQLKTVVKEVRHGHVDVDQALEDKKRAESKLVHFDETIAKLSETGIQSDLPGLTVEFKDLAVGLNVYCIPVKREGVIVKLGGLPQDPIEVQVGIVKLRVALQDLRKTRGPSTSVKTDKQLATGLKKNQPQTQAAKIEIVLPEFVPQGPTNTIDLRGLESDVAVDKSIMFLDKAILRGEAAIVLIHGHGQDKLKSAIRSMLKSNCPYEVRFRPGEASEGGDGVTVVGLRS
jgi:DNA mismatch repair protein MutS2